MNAETKGKVSFDPVWCKGCGICAAFCPVGAIRMDGKKPAAADGCIACRRCEHLCPDMAVTVTAILSE